MKITQSIYEKILNKYPIPPPEQGGILGIRNGVVCKYYHDITCTITESSVYELDVDSLNEKIEEWERKGIEFAGIIHSHMLGQDTLSSGDKAYIKTLFNNLPEWIKELYFPIVIPKTKQVVSYIAKRYNENVIIQQDEIHII